MDVNINDMLQGYVGCYESGSTDMLSDTKLHRVHAMSTAFLLHSL